MRRHYKILLVFLFSILLIHTTEKLSAQTGTEFWFAPPEVTAGHGDAPILLRLTCGATAATYTITMPARTTANFAPIIASFAANSTVTYTLSSYTPKDSIEIKPTNTVLNRGLLIQSSANITAYYEVNFSNNPELFALKGANGLGYEFYIPYQTAANYVIQTGLSPIAYASFDIVATKDTTTVLIYPTKQVDGHAALTSYTVSLNKGQTYSCAWTGAGYETPANRPAGSVVLSDKPIAITVKEDSEHIPSEGCYDLIGDQIVPVNIVGNEYIIVEGQLNGQENGYILATQNNTKIYLDGSSSPAATLFAGETYIVPVTTTVYIVATKPVYVIHVTGFGCEMGSAILPPLNCAGSQQVGFVRSTTETFYLNLLTKTTATGGFKLNGNASLVPASAFAVVPGTGGVWSYAQITFNTTDVPINTGMLLSNSIDVFSMGLVNGGSSSGCRYGFFSEFYAPIAVEAGTYGTLCANDTLQLNGSVSGGTVTGIWTTAGTGFFLPSDVTLNAKYVPSALDIANGSVQLTLTSTSICTPISDNATINFTPAPIVNAGSDLIVCRNTPTVNLNASVSIASGGLWTGGSGTFNPSATALSATYLPTAGELALDSLILTLTSTGNGICNPVIDKIKISFTPAPTVNAGVDQVICKNNPTISLSGSVSVATGGIWSGGSGTFSPSATALNATYTPTGAELTAGVITLTLTSTGVGSCAVVADAMTVTFTNAPTSNAGSDQTLCKNNANVSLSGAISIASGGSWSGGVGTYTPSSTALSTTYIPTAGELSAPLKLILTTTGNGNCLAVTDTMTVNFTNSPVVDAGVDQVVCKNNANVTLSGSVSIATGAAWSGGTGSYNPNSTTLNAIYTPSASELTAGSVKLYLTTTGNGNCIAVKDSMTITFTNSPVPNAGTDQSICKNNPNVTLSGSVSIATGGVWSGGAGTFNPSSSSLTPIYTPTPAEIASGFLRLKLTTTGNGTCLAVKDSMDITFTNSPTANAGSDVTVCANNSVLLNGSVTVAGGGLW